MQGCSVHDPKAHQMLTRPKNGSLWGDLEKMVLTTLGRAVPSVALIWRRTAIPFVMDPGTLPNAGMLSALADFLSHGVHVKYEPKLYRSQGAAGLPC